jgi:glycosyltransferase involved in cell wall biosynthesis
LLYILGLLAVIYCSSIGWIIFGFLKLFRQGKYQANQLPPLKISLLIPVRNEAKNILNCLKSLEQQQGFSTTDFEVLIINDHSTDNSLAIISSIIENSSLNLKLFSLTDKSTKKEALKLGVKNANYSIIATTDADCILPENWLISISNQLHQDTEMLLGPIDFKPSRGFLAGFQTLDMFALQGLEFGALGHHKPILNNAANLAYKKSAYFAVNGFDNFNTPSGDDVFLLEKFEANSKKISGLLSKKFVVETEIEKSLFDFFNQRLRWSSKSKFYTNKTLLYFSFIILFQNLMQLFIYFGLLLVENYRYCFGILLLSKWLIDFILLFLVADFFQRRSMMLYFIPVQIIYPIYIVTIWIASLTMKFEWKERKYNE